MTAADWTQTGALTAQGQAVTIARAGMGSLTFQLSGTFSATVTFEATNETGASPTWVSVQASNTATGVVATTATAAGMYRILSAAYVRVRCRCSAYTSGTINVVATASYASTISGAAVDTELPAAAALADATANPTTTSVGSFIHTFNGTTWDRARCDTAANVNVTLRSLNGTGGTTCSGAYQSGDAAASPTGSLSTTAFPVQWNGTNWDRVRGNVDATYLASAARTATPTVSDITTYNASGITVVLDATAIAATPSVVVTIEGKDSVSGKYYNILTGAAITGVSTNVYKVALGVTVAANAAVSQPLPRVIRILPTHGDADSITYSIGYTLHV